MVTVHAAEGLKDHGFSGWRMLVHAGVLALLAARPAFAQADRSLHIHGFGDWVYGRTNGNDYQSGDREGTAEDAAIGINLHYEAGDRVTVVGQVAFEHSLDGRDRHSRFLFDYAFAQYTVSDRVHLRLGRTYHPFGIYSEIRDIGTARPFIERPEEIYGDLAIISTSLDGLDVYGDLLAASSWRLHYDAYAGTTELTVAEPGEQSATDENIRSVLGGKLTADTPLDGLRISVSAFHGNNRKLREDHWSEALSLDYASDKCSLRAEVAEHVESSEHVRGGYVEGGFRPTEHWQAVARFGTVHQTHGGSVDSRFLHHRDTAVGLNYWFDPRLVLKLEYHLVDGSRLAVSEDAGSGRLRDSTRLLQVGVQFSF